MKWMDSSFEGVFDKSFERLMGVKINSFPNRGISIKANKHQHLLKCTKYLFVYH